MCTKLHDEVKSELVSIDDLQPGDMVRLEEEGHTANGNVYLKIGYIPELVNLTNQGQTIIGSLIRDGKRFRRFSLGESFTLVQE